MGQKVVKKVGSIKLYHPTVRPNPGAQHAVYVVETDKEYPVPYLCPICNRAEPFKSIHLRIGSEGVVYVSPEIFEALKPVLSKSGLEHQETLAVAPDQVVGAVELPKQQVVHLPLNDTKRYSDAYNPGRTKYESRDRLLVPRFRFGKKRKKR